MRTTSSPAVNRAARAIAVAVLVGVGALALSGATPGAVTEPSAPTPIRPGREDDLMGALRAPGLVCGDAAPDCAFDVEIHEATIDVVRRGERLRLHLGPPPEGCAEAAAGLSVCPLGDGADPRAAAALAGRLGARPEAAAVIASLWQAPTAPPRPVPRRARALDALLLVWLGVFAAALVVALRGLAPRDRLVLLTLLAAALALRLLRGWGPANFYVPIDPDGPFGDRYPASYPVVFDSDYRFAAAFGAGGDVVYAAIRLLLGALAPALFFLAGRRAGLERPVATAWGLLLAGDPLLVWTSATDGQQVWPLAMAGAACLGAVLRPTALGLVLVFLSLVLGVAVRVETAPSVILAGWLAFAVSGGRTWRRAGLLAAATALALVAAGALFAGTFLARTGAEIGSWLEAPETWPGYALWFAALRTPATPTAAWAAIQLPLVAVGLWYLWRTRRAAAAPLVWLGLIAAMFPLWVSGFVPNSLAAGRYAVLAPPFVQLLVAFGAGGLATLAFARRPARAAAALGLLCLVAPAAGLAAAGFPGIAAKSSWDAEYEFLHDAIAGLPEGCTVVHKGADPWLPPELVGGGWMHRLLGLPNPVLGLARPDLSWEEQPAGALRGPATTPCRAVYLGTDCSLCETPPAGADLAAWRDSRTCRACRDLAARADGPVLAEATITGLDAAPAWGTPDIVSAVHLQLVWGDGYRPPEAPGAR